MKPNEYIVRFTYGKQGTHRDHAHGRTVDQWWCDLFGTSPAHEADEARGKLAEGHSDTMAGALAQCALNWREGYQ